MQEKKEEDLQQVFDNVSEVGIDEVGRGAVFGPVFSAVVVLTEKNKFKLKQFGIKDSKKLTPKFFKIDLFFLVNTTTAEKTGPKTAPLPTSSSPTSVTLFNSC